MTSVQVNIDKKMMDMVARFRVIELQELLGHAGKNKSGKKSDLVERAMQLVRSSGYNEAIQTKIFELYERRYPRQASLLDSKFSSLLNHNGTNGRQLEIRGNSSPMSLMRHPGPTETVKFKSLPFYKNVVSILPPVILNSNPSHCYFEHVFLINQVQIEFLRDLPNKKTRQMQLRFCVFDTSSEQEDRLPPGLQVQVNGHFVSLPPLIPPTKSGVKPKQLHLPLDITPICERIGLHKQFKLSVKWSKDDSPKSYAASIRLVQLLSIDDLLGQLHDLGPLPAFESRRLVREKLSSDPDSDIATTSLKVSLLCPLGKMRMNLPARPEHCRHLQCFDAAFFLMMNQKKPTWVCPVCDKSADFSALRLDGLFMEMIKNSDSDEIEFTEDGNWHGSKKKEEAISLPNNPIDLSQSSRAPKEQDSGGTSKNVDVIDLTADSSDDETTVDHSVKASPSRVATPVSIPSSPLEVANFTTTNGRLSSPYSSLQKSPQKYSSPYLSPSRSPFYHRDSPRLLSRSSHVHPYVSKPSDSSRRTPIKQTAVTSRYSPFLTNPPLDPNHNISSYFTPSPASISNFFPFPSFDIPVDSYDPNFLLRLSQQQFGDPMTQRYLNPFLPIYPYVPLNDPSTLQSTPNIPDSRPADCGLNTPQPNYNSDRSLNADSIPID